eukprot:TRINITY_DN4965_c0_g1_i1.p1 TRINITY_DN4965_c0_g1~~TRINITY_DN4965_c0_g1_i1.p1  ORF type:complete len:123 (+),score=34.56 TRINITY_DN4965_c0_g1_i1:94-462(+)
MSSTMVGDEQEMRRRKKEQSAAEEEKNKKNAEGDDAEEISAEDQEYIDYFRTKYGENPRSDILGIDGVGLFCLIYIVVCGVIFSLIFMSVYARNREVFGKISLWTMMGMGSSADSGIPGGGK